MYNVGTWTDISIEQAIFKADADGKLVSTRMSCGDTFHDPGFQ